MLAPKSGPSALPYLLHLFFAEDRGRGRVGEPLPLNVRDFGKAYTLSFLGMVQLTALNDRLDATRFLGVALDGAPLEATTMAVLDRAMAAIREHYSLAAARNRGVQLELIAEFLDESGIARADLAGWSLGCPNPNEIARIRGSTPEASAARLPTPAFRDAVTTSFALSVLPHHVLISGGCVVLRSVPSRIGQVLKLEENAAQPFEEGGQRRLRILLPGSKSGRPTSKLVDKEMSPIATLAFNRMLKVTAEPRAMKRHYRDHAETLYLPPALEHLRGQDLYRDQASMLLGINPKYLQQYAGKLGLDIVDSEVLIPFRVIEQHILAQLPFRMEAAGGPDYKPLMLIKWRSLRTEGSPCMFESLRYQAVNMALKPRGGNVGMFQRLGIESPESATGTTHMFRRELVTDGIKGGLSADDLFQWAGASDHRWIPSYDYTTDADFRDPLTGVSDILLDGIAEALGDGDGDGDEE